MKKYPYPLSLVAKAAGTSVYNIRKMLPELQDKGYAKKTKFSDAGVFYVSEKIRRAVPAKNAGKHVIRVRRIVADYIRANGSRFINDVIRDYPEFPEVPEKADAAGRVRVYLAIEPDVKKKLAGLNMSGTIENVLMAHLRGENGQ
jgi:hypothetical protein